MKQSFRTGLGFGITSGIITTLGLMVGLSASTQSKLAVVGGILVIALADALSDVMGIHMSEESRNENKKGVWESTFSTFFFKLIFALTFVVPVLAFESMRNAIFASIFWALILLTGFSYYIACLRKENPWHQIAEHITLATIVITLSHYVGVLVRYLLT